MNAYVYIKRKKTVRENVNYENLANAGRERREMSTALSDLISEMLVLVHDFCSRKETKQKRVKFV